MKQARSRMAFTLIELLTVIAIIGVLAALLFPAIKGALLKAEIGKAQVAISHLGSAFKSYYTEYGKWPIADAAVPPKSYYADANVVALLSGQDITSAATKDSGAASGTLNGNPRKIVFLEFKQADIGTVPSCAGCYMDPWKQPYHFRVDVAYGNVIPNPFLNDPTITVTNGVLVWSAGPDGVYDNLGDIPPSPKNKDNVKSW